MKKLIVSHIYNEEYMLPWWLQHHRKYFDHGIIIDYHSTDNSREIIKHYCPTWDIVSSRNAEYDEIEMQKEILFYENSYDDSWWKICLNVTEFLVGDYNQLDINKMRSAYMIPCLYFVDDQELRDSSTLTYDKPLWETLKTGLSSPLTLDFRGSRLLRTWFLEEYPIGRHYKFVDNDSFIIFNYGFSPMTEEFYKRKLQIQNIIPASQRNLGYARQHTDGLSEDGLTREKLAFLHKDLLISLNYFPSYIGNFSGDLSLIMNKYLEMLPHE